MADDKSKSHTKKALLGELESIKSLLDESPSDRIDFEDDFAIDDDLLDPPILTTAVDSGLDPDQDRHLDIPILTEAFDSVIADIEAEESQPDAFAEPDFEQWPDTEDHESYAEELEEVVAELTDVVDVDDEESNSLFDDLEAEFTQHFIDDNDLTATKTQTKTAKPEAKTPLAKTATTKLDANNKPAAKPAVAKTDEESSKKRGAKETQPSLFDTSADGNSSAESQATIDNRAEIEKLENDLGFGNVDAKLNSVAKPLEKQEKTQTPDTNTAASIKTSSTTAKSTTSDKSAGNYFQKVDTHTTAKRLNTAALGKNDNPFLPKHIRDRLHTSRSLQEELTSINAVSTTLNVKTPVKARATPASELDNLVDELVNAHLPKIEQELRRRLRESLQQQATDKDSSD